MNVAVLIAFVKEPSDILLLADRVTAALDALPQVRWTMTALIAGSETDFETAARIAAQHARLGAALFPDSETLWRDAVASVPADADVVVTLDGATDSPEDIPALLEPLENESVGSTVGVRRSPPVAPKGLEGVLVQTVTGGAATDVTSTIRAFRGAAVRQVRVRVPGVEALAAAAAEVTALGLRTVEVPVTTSAPDSALPKHFGFTLFRHGLTSRFALVAVLLVLAGLSVFLISSYPVHQYVADSDSVISGLCAVDVLEGRQWLFFPTGFRLGPPSCYVGSVVVALLGRSREALASITMFYVLVYLTFIYLALKVALGRVPALVGMMGAAFPPLQYVLFIEPPWGYGEIMVCTAITWWFGFVLLFRPGLRSKRMSFLYGLLLGLTFWTSPQSLMLTAPLTLMLVFRRVFPNAIDFVLVGAGFVLGLWAYIVTVLQKGLEPFTTNFATKPVDTLAQLLSNIDYLFSYVLPIFFLNSGLPAPTPKQGFLLLVLIAGLLTTTWTAWRWLRSRTETRCDARTGLMAVFTVGVVVTSCALFVSSGAGSVRGWTPRYLAPIFFAVPLMLANLYAIAQRNAVTAVVLVCGVAFAGINASTYRFPGNPDRNLQEVALWNDQKAYNWLRERGRSVALGDYWVVYKLNFGFGKGVDGVPIPTFIDYTSLLRQRVAKGEPVHLALIHVHEPSLAVWASRAGLQGHIERMDGGYYAFLVDGVTDPKRMEPIAALYQ